MKLNKFVEMHQISARTIARATGLTVPTIIGYIEEKRMPNVENAFKIEKATLGIVKATDFIPGETHQKTRVTLRKKKKSATKQTS